MSAAPAGAVSTAAVAGGYEHPTPSTLIVEETLAARGHTGGRIDLTTSYEVCRRINAAHGRTYYTATRLLPAASRPHVHAIYAFARYADDLVDHLALDWDAEQRRAALEGWAAEFLADLERGDSEDPVCKATIHTVRTLGIDHGDLDAFLRSMAMDLTVTRYETYEDLLAYMHGSAAVIGSMMLPVLQPLTPAAREPAMTLGVAFQLTNFLRDVAEDLQRGRIYLPMEDLDRFGVTEEMMQARRVTPEIRLLLTFEIARTRRLYESARAGWGMLPSASARCVRTAHTLYERILDRIEAADHQVFDVRAVVPAWQKLGVAVRQMATPVPAPPPALPTTSTLDGRVPVIADRPRGQTTAGVRSSDVRPRPEPK